ncbi:MAG: hypothetical protein LBG29_02885 [Synergistaceae bacterium]|jgi:hypothetical protein|nr:hypothetical protein [Synergistaceae bacterium]
MKGMKKILTAVLAVAMALALFTAGAFAEGGDGTAGDPLQIGTADELLEFASRVAGGNASLCALLTDDITVSDWADVMSIGRPASGTSDSTTPYAGTFDGGGHTLSLTAKMEGTTAADASGIALFHTIAKDGVVRNINLDVDFRGNSYIGGVAVRNYGTIERVTVGGAIATRGITGAYAGGIAAWNGNTLIDDEYIAGRILYCVNKAEIYSYATGSGALAGKTPYGSSAVGGISGSFLGEMRYCANLGKIWVNNSNATSGNGGGASLCTIRAAVTGPVQIFIISDCYNAGTVSFTSTSSGVYSGGLIASQLVNIMNWGDEGGVVEISNVFNYGLMENPYLAESPNNSLSAFNIIGAVTDDAVSDFHIANIFSNIYYNPKIGGHLFGIPEYWGDDGYGTARIKTVIKGKSVEEFASAEMAALLNNGRTGTDAPWEYIQGDYPTLKAPSAFDWDTAAAPTTRPLKYAKAFYGGAVTYNSDGTCTITAKEDYVIDEIWLDGELLRLGERGLREYTTAAPIIGLFATFSYTANFNAPAGGKLSVSRVSDTPKSEIESGSIVHAAEILRVAYDGPGRLVFTGLEAAGNTGEYKVTALRATAGPTITAVPAGSGGGGSGPGSGGGSGSGTNTGGSSSGGDSGTTAVAVPGGSVTVPSDTVIDESAGIATLPGGEITLADGTTALIVPPDTTIDLDTGIITVTQGGAVTLPAGGVSGGLGIEYIVPPGTTIDSSTGTVSVAADAGALTLPGPDGATGSDQDNIEVIVPPGTTIDPATGIVTAVNGGWTILPGHNRVIDTPLDMRRGAAAGDDLEIYVTPGTTVDPYTGSVTITKGGEITLPDGTTVTVPPGTTIDPFTGVRNEPGAANEGSDNTGTADLTDGGSGGGCDAGTAGFALLAMAMIAASAAGKKTR